MIAIPKTISMEFVRSLTPTDVREILENASNAIDTGGEQTWQ